MRIATYYNNNDIRLEEIPKPKIGDGEVLLKIVASGICGTDVIEWYRIHRAPLILGHEIAGEIAQVGQGVKKYKEGNRVVVSHHVPCGSCRFCRSGHETTCDTLRKTNIDPGGFAEYVRIPKINVEKGIYPVPDGISYEEATFAEPLACVLRAQRKIKLNPSDTVLILGSGISGLLHIKLARAKGVDKIFATDINKFRLKKALEFGASKVYEVKPACRQAGIFDPDKIKADKVLVCTGAKSAQEDALKSIERGGTVLFFACTAKDVTIPFSINDVFWRSDVTLTTSYAGSPEDHTEALEWIGSGKIKVKDMITHRFGLAEAEKGFRLVAEAKESIKVIIEPQR